MKQSKLKFLPWGSSSARGILFISSWSLAVIVADILTGTISSHTTAVNSRSESQREGVMRTRFHDWLDFIDSPDDAIQSRIMFSSFCYIFFITFNWSAYRVIRLIIIRYLLFILFFYSYNSPLTLTTIIGRSMKIFSKIYSNSVLFCTVICTNWLELTYIASTYCPTVDKQYFW